jgi:hypothetical protein
LRLRVWLGLRAIEFWEEGGIDTGGAEVGERGELGELGSGAYRGASTKLSTCTDGSGKEGGAKERAVSKCVRGAEAGGEGEPGGVRARGGEGAVK